MPLSGREGAGGGETLLRPVQDLDGRKEEVNLGLLPHPRDVTSHLWVEDRVFLEWGEV